MSDEIYEAYSDWQQAQHIFDNAVEPDEIAYAIYNLEAKKQRYAFLLSQEKKK